jgi:hypothetical protein
MAEMTPEVFLVNAFAGTPSAVPSAREHERKFEIERENYPRGARRGFRNSKTIFRV